jgi:RNA polymerase sigma-70 factor (ECF subfamily)
MSRQAPATHGDANVADWYRDHFARLTRLATCMLGGTEGAEDVAQEALLRAWEHRDALDHPDAIGPWLARVARNLCIDVLRNGRDVVPLGDADPPAEPVIPPIDADPVVDVRRALSKLNPRHRHALYQREVADVDYCDLAADMGIGETAARMVLVRARRAFRNHLESDLARSA